MTAVAHTVAFTGIDTIAVEVQVAMASGLPTFTIVGLPDKAVGESRERVRAAFAAMGLALPAKRITVNLAPADVSKEGSHYDLPIAVGLLTAMDLLPAEDIDHFLALGELSLDGRVAPVAGVLPAAMAAHGDDKGLICPAAQGSEAAWAAGAETGFEILAPTRLLDLIQHFKGAALLPRPEPLKRDAKARGGPDLREVKGQETAKRALEITAAGGHNLLMIGPPGSGKSLLARCLPGLLPPLTAAEALEVSTIHSVAGQLRDGALITQRPFRDPHHAASQPALVGGGLRAKPGEVSLAHKGVLFLDELPEFQRNTLEALRQPLEHGMVSIARANSHVTYPARVQMVAAMNPCPCGYLSDPAQACSRAPKCAEPYQGRISGPLFDRIDLHVEVAAVPPWDLARIPDGETTQDVAARVAQARFTQADRYAALAPGTGILTNAEADGSVLEEAAALEPNARDLLAEAAERLRLSARAWHRMMRVARTIADLAGSASTTRTHVAEALSYRRIAPGKG